MSQRITFEVAKTLKKGDRLYHNIIDFTAEDGSKTPATAVVTGKVKPHPVEEFMLPIRLEYGSKCESHVSRFGTNQWRTVPEKYVEPRVSRVRRPTESQAADSSEVEDEPKPGRVRRTRVVEQEPVRKRRTRAG